MRRHSKKISYRSIAKSSLPAAGIAASLAFSPVAKAEGLQNVALHDHSPRDVSFETGNLYSEGTLELSFGTMQADQKRGPGTGTQVYFGGASYSFTDRFTVGINGSSTRDPVRKPINGLFPDMRMEAGALWGKFGILSNEAWDIAALASLENLFILESPVWGGSSRNVFVGALKAPISYRPSSELQLTLTPSVSIFPDSVNGTAFYGTIFSIGAGVSYRPSDRLSFFGSVDVPVSGDNTITNTATYDAVPVWTVGGRYAVTPKVALEVYATNGVGMTPATSVLSFWPDGDSAMAGINLVYTPGANRPESYRGVPAPVTARQAALQLDGFTLGTPDTLEPGQFSVGAWYGADNNAGFALGFSPDRDGEIQLIVEQFSDNPTAPPLLVPTTDARFMFGPKLRFLDQNNGNAYTLTGRALVGRIFQSGNSSGVFFAELMAGYKVNNVLSLTAAAKGAAFDNTRIAGLGLGVNYAISDTLSLIGEVTPVGLDGSDATWAAGLRYDIAGSGFVMDLQGTNAIGRYGIGSMVAQDDPRIALTLTKVFDARGAKFY